MYLKWPSLLKLMNSLHLVGSFWTNKMHNDCNTGFGINYIYWNILIFLVYLYRKYRRTCFIPFNKTPILWMASFLLSFYSAKLCEVNWSLPVGPKTTSGFKKGVSGFKSPNIFFVRVGGKLWSGGFYIFSPMLVLF